LRQSAAKVRDAAVAELYEWMGEFETAKIALADDVQLLEALEFGVVE